MSSENTKADVQVAHEPMLATFVVTAYNQEKYVREAVEGAFSQTYSPLEIILTDDCSNDSTFEIMRSMARDYKGPHAIRLNRNVRNLGVTGHVNRSADMMNGEIRVGSAGDDISLPERTAKMVEYFSKSADIFCVTCGAELIGDKAGLFIPWAPNRKLHLMELCALNLGQQGSTSSYRRSVFKEFPPLCSESKAEDFALTFRASLMGIRLAVPDILVKYRSHSSCLANRAGTSDIENKKNRLSLSSMIQAENDLQHYSKMKGINPVLAISALRLRIYSYERLARAAERGVSEDVISLVILNILSGAKAFRLLHPLSWLQGRKFAQYVKSECEKHKY